MRRQSHFEDACAVFQWREEERSHDCGFFSSSASRLSKLTAGSSPIAPSRTSVCRMLRAHIPRPHSSCHPYSRHRRRHRRRHPRLVSLAHLYHIVDPAKQALLAARSFFSDHFRPRCRRRCHRHSGSRPPSVRRLQRGFTTRIVDLNHASLLFSPLQPFLFPF